MTSLAALCFPIRHKLMYRVFQKMISMYMRLCVDIHEHIEIETILYIANLDLAEPRFVCVPRCHCPI